MSRIFYKSKTWLKKSSPTILTCMGALGVIATSVLAVKATPDANKKIKADSISNHDGDAHAYTNLEAVRSSWTCYVPAAVVGVSTITCIFGANMLNKKKQATLMSAYAMLNEYYKQYRKAAVAVYGEDADRNIQSEMAKESYISWDGYYVYDPDLDVNDKILFYDTYSRRYFNATMAAVINAQYNINRNLTLRGDACVNEWYNFLGIGEIDKGYEVGWGMTNIFEGGLAWLDFDNRSTMLEDGLECYVISYMIEPSKLYDDD